MNLMPQEIEVWYVLPAIRAEMARELANDGMKQARIAELFGLTRAAVCQYLKQKRANEIKFNNRIKKEIKKSCSRIIKEKECAIKEIQTICSFIKSSGFLCSIHKKYNEVCSECKQSI